MNSADEDGTLGAAISVGMSAEFQRGLDAAVDKAGRALRESVERRASLGVEQAQGFFAEQWHKQTLEIDAYKKGIWGQPVEVPQSTVRGSPDIVVDGGPGQPFGVQLKYYKDAARTAKQFWNPDYDGQAKVVPSDQLDAIRKLSAEQAAMDPRPHVRRSAAHTAEVVSDRLKANGGVESKPLSRADSSRETARTHAGEDVLAGMRALSPREIASKAAVGGAVAAGIGFAVGAAPKVLELVEAWRRGQRLGDLEFDALLHEGVVDGARNALTSGLQGAISTALVHAAAAGHLGNTLAEIGPGPIGAISVVVLQAMRDGVALCRGELDAAAFAWRTVKNASVSACSCGGAALGQLLIPIPFLGALIGSAVGGLVANVGIAGVEWTAEKLRPHVDAAIDRMGEILFAWDLIAEARAQSASFEAALVQADIAFADLRQLELRAFAELSLPAIHVDAISAHGREQRTKLEVLEDEWAAFERLRNRHG